MTTSTNRRKSLRLKHWDYKNTGLYFVTICVNNRQNLFGEIKNGEIMLNDAGKMVDKQWQNIFTRFQNAKTNKYVIMPNHFHALIEIGLPPMPTQTNVAQQLAKTNPSLGEIIGPFKSITTNEYIRRVRKSNWPKFHKKLWQRNYYEHVIRDNEDYYQIAEYIETNPLKWELDSLHPDYLKVIS